MVALDGGTRPGDTLQILPLALAQPPNPRSITSHSELRGHPSLTHRVGFFRGIQWGIHSQKIIIGTAICFLRKYAFPIENIKLAHTIYIYINLLYSLAMCKQQCNYYMYAYSFIYIYSSYGYIYIYMCVCICVRKLQENLKSIVNLSSLQ